MSDLIAGFGIALVLEGLLWAAAPQTARRTLESIAALSTTRIQAFAVAAVALGVLIFWLARG